ncbi:MAG: phosphopantothenoylcysteine decarboxylase [Phycisphaerae bacterium]|nr:phosphopantothenoylcysteine decarboxylase [Phycisphaerae bacterium]
MRILITAGPTREYLDRVRFISNPSSGRMGLALAAAAKQRGHTVTLVCGPMALRPPRGVRIVRVETTREMLAAAQREFARCDAAIFAAAVCDYRPVRRSPHKLPKQRGVWRLALEPTEDIAATLGERKRGRITVGFALEDRAGRRRAAAKLRAKRFDAIVLNPPSAIDAEETRVEFLAAGGRWERWPTGRKVTVAARLIRCIERMARSG